MQHTHLAQLVLLLHLAAVVEVAQPGGDVQPPVQLLLRVRLGRGQRGSLDGKLHAGFFKRHLTEGVETLRRNLGEAEELPRSPIEGFNVSGLRPDLVFELSFPAALPLLEDLGQLIQAGVMEVEDLVLALSAGDDQLTAGARLIAERKKEEDMQRFTSQCWIATFFIYICHL